MEKIKELNDIDNYYLKGGNFNFINKKEKKLYNKCFVIVLSSYKVLKIN